MKKVLTLALVLAVGVVITGCSAESTPAKTSSTVVKTTGTPAK